MTILVNQSSNLGKVQTMRVNKTPVSNPVKAPEMALGQARRKKVQMKVQAQRENRGQDLRVDLDQRRDQAQALVTTIMRLWTLQHQQQLPQPQLQQQLHQLQ